MQEARTLERASAYKTHPILIAAGVAVLLFSLLGAAALTGILPTATPKAGDPAVARQAKAAQPSAKPGAPAPARKVAAGPCANCGAIEAIRAVEVKGKTSGVGAVAGGVAGGVLGNAIGGGQGAGNAVLTIGGAAGGAFAGDAIEGQMKKHTVWRVTVRLEDGSVRTVQQGAQPPFAIGDRVRIVDGKQIERA